MRLSDDHRSIVGYVAGQPFPLIDPNDPYVANKIIWNNVFRPITTDDYDLRFYDCDTAYEQHGPQTQQIEYFQIGHYAGYDLVGRTEVEPLPTDPDFKSTNRLWLFALYPVLAPQDIRGTGFIRWRYADPSRGDDIWSLDAGSRRVRRLNEVDHELLDPPGPRLMHGIPITIRASIPRPRSTTTNSSARRTCSACVHAAHSPEVRCPTDGGTSACPEDWEMRHMYVVEATPRDRSSINALDSRTIVYMDQRNVVRALHRYL